MNKYYTPALYAISITFGLITGFVFSFFADLPLTILAGALTTLLLATIFPLSMFFSDRKFAPLKKGIVGPFLLDERVNYIVKDELKRGFLVMNKESLFVIAFDAGTPVKFELKKNDIKKVSITDNIYLNIFLDFDKYIRLASANCEEILQKCTDEGFGI